MTLLVIIILVLSYCNTARKATVTTPVINYTNNIQSLVLSKCSPCHIPDKGGNKKALITYEALRSSIDDILHRVELNPGEKGFMPFKRPKLSDSTIMVFRQWKTDGLKEN